MTIIRFICTIILLAMNASSLGLASASLFQENGTGISSIKYFETADDSGSNSLDCSSACKNGLPCASCGPGCCSQFAEISSYLLTCRNARMVKSYSVLQTPPSPALFAPKEPPRI